MVKACLQFYSCPRLQKRAVLLSIKQKTLRSAGILWLLAKDFSHLFNVTPILYHFDGDFLFYDFHIASILITGTAIERFEVQTANSCCAKRYCMQKDSRANLINPIFLVVFFHNSGFHF